MKKLLILCFVVFSTFASVGVAQKKTVAKPFTTSGFYDGINIGSESGDPGGMSVFLTESDGQLYALVMTAAGDFFEPVLVKAEMSGKNNRTIEIVLPEPSRYDGAIKYKGIVSANNLTFSGEEVEETKLKRSCGYLYSNIKTGSGGDYGGTEIFLYDMAGELYALVTIAEGILLRPVLVKTVPKRSKDLILQSFTFTLPADNGERKFTGIMSERNPDILTLAESGGGKSVLKTKCYR